MPRILQQFIEASDIAYDIIKRPYFKALHTGAPRIAFFENVKVYATTEDYKNDVRIKPMCASNHQGASKIQRCDTPVRLNVQLEHWKYLRQK